MKRIAIQQTLHGYSEGHRLLGGSIKLTDEFARLVLRMSDLSGGNVVPGFEEYLTGYPLDGLNMYALAKTWYATEMPRPGSVWTHTLFIPSEALTDICDLQVLTTHFQRPSMVSPANAVKLFASYSESILFDTDNHSFANSAAGDGSSIQIADLIETLYTQCKDNILIGAQTARSFESSLLRVWSQQWPCARKAFSFCTGALSARGFAGKPFDVQCAPPALVREIISTTTAKLSQEITLLIKSDQVQSAWFAMAIEDAQKPQGGTFREMLWGFAGAADRKQYRQFALIIAKLLGSSKRCAQEFISIVAEQYPSKEAGLDLKSALFGVGRTIPGFKPFEEGEILFALASSPHFEAYDSAALLLKKRGCDLCNQNPVAAREAISNIFRSQINTLGEDILAGMVEAMTPDIARHVTSERPQFLPTLFRAKPELGKSTALWAAAGNRKRDLLESLVSFGKLDDSLVGEVVKALMESDSEFLIPRALEAWNQPAVFGMLSWMSTADVLLSSRSTTALTYHVESIARWVTEHPDRPQHVVISTAHIIAPYTYQFRQLHTGVWLDCYKQLVVENNRHEADFFGCMLLALGFQNALPDALLLIEECFEHIHQRAWDDALSEDAWFILHPIVPHLWWHRDWDKCERLRRGLVGAFVQFKWPIVKLAICVKNDVFLQRVIESATHVDGGREFISQRF
ncbi:MAG: hypothetical protein P4N60_06765 [Verrucomicrobiae bacterium]|nr:hypothetical protein [Verrucomicrobiae bacterium]